ncbi:MAG: glycerate kinase, partial [Bacteroidales bacterium]|nr:glycerate kinase [Bacteroidales bacterium]
MSFRKIIIASDSFKGCLSSLEVADAIAAGLNGHKIVRIGIADGGEGTAETLTRSLGGRTVGVMVHDPAGRRIM